MSININSTNLNINQSLVLSINTDTAISPDVRSNQINPNDDGDFLLANLDPLDSNLDVDRLASYLFDNLTDSEFEKPLEETSSETREQIQRLSTPIDRSSPSISFACSLSTNSDAGTSLSAGTNQINQLATTIFLSKSPQIDNLSDDHITDLLLEFNLNAKPSEVASIHNYLSANSEFEKPLMGTSSKTQEQTQNHYPNEQDTVASLDQEEAGTSYSDVRSIGKISLKRKKDPSIVPIATKRLKHNEEIANSQKFPRNSYLGAKGAVSIKDIHFTDEEIALINTLSEEGKGYVAIATELKKGAEEGCDKYHVRSNSCIQSYLGAKGAVSTKDIPFTDEERALINTLSEEGKSYVAIATELKKGAEEGCDKYHVRSNNCIQSYLKAKGAVSTKKTPFTKEEITLINTLSKEGKSYVAIATELKKGAEEGCDKYHVRSEDRIQSYLRAKGAVSTKDTPFTKDEIALINTLSKEGKGRIAIGTELRKRAEEGLDKYYVRSERHIRSHLEMAKRLSDQR